MQIDINPGSIGAHSKVDMALIGDIKSTRRPAAAAGRKNGPQIPR
ncbi:MAG: hypothetical protein ACLTXH_10685 [Enterobacter hormaechei]